MHVHLDFFLCKKWVTMRDQHTAMQMTQFSWQRSNINFFLSRFVKKICASAECTGFRRRTFATCFCGMLFRSGKDTSKYINFHLASAPLCRYMHQRWNLSVSNSPWCNSCIHVDEDIYSSRVVSWSSLHNTCFIRTATTFNCYIYTSLFAVPNGSRASSLRLVTFYPEQEYKSVEKTRTLTRQSQMQIK